MKPARSLTVDAEFEGMRLDRYISKAEKSLPRAAVQRLIRVGDIKVNGKKTSSDARLKTGDTVELYVLPQSDENREKTSASEANAKLDILYEDEFLLAVNKPPFLPSQPSFKGQDCMSLRIKTYLRDAEARYGGLFSAGCANRLDTNTSGIILAAKTPSSAASLAETIRKNEVDKQYLALVKGSFDKNIKAVNYAKRDSDANMTTLYDNPAEGLVKMASVFSPCERLNGSTLVKAKLITGRTHQIRAQLAHLGFPIALDYKYGEAAYNEKIKKLTGLSRQFLHCSCVSFKLWYDGSVLKITCPLPEDLQGAADKLKLK